MSENWFRCTVSFDCPHCGELSEETIITSATLPDRDAVARQLSDIDHKCQKCLKPLQKNGTTNLGINVYPTSEAELKSQRITAIKRSDA
jgi:hypothetical protein